MSPECGHMGWGMCCAVCIIFSLIIIQQKFFLHVIHTYMNIFQLNDGEKTTEVSFHLRYSMLRAQKHEPVQWNVECKLCYFNHKRSGSAHKLSGRFCDVCSTSRRLNINVLMSRWKEKWHKLIVSAYKLLTFLLWARRVNL